MSLANGHATTKAANRNFGFVPDSATDSEFDNIKSPVELACPHSPFVCFRCYALKEAEKDDNLRTQR